jgi:glycosyltransferase involved in cell wall biosynthesis
MEVERLPMLGPPKLNRYLGFPVFANPFWLRSMSAAARRFRPDTIIVSDLPLAPAALMIGRMMEIPVHYDIADVYPVAMRSNQADHPGLISRFTRNPDTADRIDSFVVRRAASTFVVSEEVRRRCLALGAPPASVVLVGNTPADVPPRDYRAPIPADIADWAERPIVLFLGNLLADRGLLIAIDAIDRIRAAVPSVALAIVGSGRETLALAEEIDRRKLHDRVRLLGWKAPADHYGYYQQALIGILPFHSTPHINITLANKLFDYMSAGLPVIGSDGPPMRRVLEETGAGIVVPPQDAAALGRAIVDLIGDATRRAAFGEAGRAAVDDGAYAWKRDEARFVAAIERTKPRG